MTPTPRWISDGFSFGGDYNPEQWPESVWQEDIQLMQQAGVNLVTVAVFSWSFLETRRDTFEFAWLDRIMDLLHAGGIGVDLATATASPPPWLTYEHPEILPVMADGTVRYSGGRQAFCISSPVYRERSRVLVEQLATRYGNHPALKLWHVSNEIGCHNAHCFCEVSAAAFRVWLRSRYRTLDELNEAWGTAFWSQRYTEWEQITTPRLSTYIRNPGQQLDFFRFSSDELLHNFRIERDILHRITPDVPVTTNFMSMSGTKNMNYFRWAAEVDVVSTDHYAIADQPDRHIELAMCADLTRGFARGAPWLLMEHSTSAVNWQARNGAKAPGELKRNSLAHVAHGADSVMFFQWRQSSFGSERYHSGMVPHAGTDTQVFRAVSGLGQDLKSMADVIGSTIGADVAIVFDYEAWWALELDSHPSSHVRYMDRVYSHYKALWNDGIAVDIVHPTADLTAYRLVIVPNLYLVSDDVTARVTAYVHGGGTVVIGYLSGIVDERNHVRQGGFPGAFRELLGVRSEEFFPLAVGEVVQLSDGTTADLWTELLHLDGAEAIVEYIDGPLPAVPAITRKTQGNGTAWYVAARLDDAGMAALTRRIASEVGLTTVAQSAEGVEVTRRSNGDRSWLFVINHTDSEVLVHANGTELFTGATVTDNLTVAAGACAVVHES
ncbi:MAG: beta-galactosidase [Actinomycetota bacterium]